VEGAESDFNNEKDVKKAAAILGQLHKASKGFISSKICEAKDELGNIPVYFQKRLGELKKLKKIASKGKTKFDYNYLQYVDYFLEQGEKAFEGIKGMEYAKLVEVCKEEKLFCHHDYTHSNIIWVDNKLWITNFEYCCYELKVYDLANLLRRKMRKCNWDINQAKLMLREYCKNESLCNDDLLVMKYILQFPQKFWRVANRFYNSRRSWAEKSYLNRLEEVGEEVVPHRIFLERYDSII
jgi:spore coat protein I